MQQVSVNFREINRSDTLSMNETHDLLWMQEVSLSGFPHSSHIISAGGSLLFMRCVSLTLTGLVSAWRRGEALSAILAKPLSDCVTVFV